MRRTNEEFRAEVFRRKSEILRARKARNKGIFTAVLCLPLCFIVVFAGLSLAIGMQGAGSAVPNDKNNSMDAPIKEFVITEHDRRLEPIREFFADITVREPENADFDWDLNRSFSYKVTIALDGKIYYLNNMYVFDGENTFSITFEEYGIFRDIIILEEGEGYEK